MLSEFMSPTQGAVDAAEVEAILGQGVRIVAVKVEANGHSIGRIEIHTTKGTVIFEDAGLHHLAYTLAWKKVQAVPIDNSL